MADPTELRDLAAAIAHEAAALLLDALTGTREVDTKSSATDMVTEMDRRSESLVVERITAARPDDAIIGEEGSDRRGTTGICWVVDPLDGTTNYLYRYPGWAVSIGVEVDGLPIAGAVDVPSTGDRFAAAAGAGTTRNGRPLRIADDPAPLEHALVGTGFNYDPATRARQARGLVHLLPRIRDIRRGGAAAADICSVAAGRLDAFYESGLSHWDHSAGTIVAREAGLRVEHVPSEAMPTPAVVVAHPDRWDELVAVLRTAGLVDG